jgi:hypothetical protein
MPVLPSFAAVPILLRIEHDTRPQLLALSLAILLRYHKNRSTVPDDMEEEGINSWF